MQILHWLFERPDDFSLAATIPCGLCSVVCPGETKRRALAIYNEVSCEEEEEDEPTLTIVLRRQSSRTCFYSTLRLGHLRGLFKSDWRMGHCKAETMANVGCKVLPICDAVSTTSNCSGRGGGGGDSGSDGSEKDAERGERRSAVASRMKELLRWAAAAAKSSRGGSSGKGWKALYFRHKAAAQKAEAEDSSSASSKMSFKWDAGSCSTSASVYSPLSLPSTSRNDHAMAKNLSRLSLNLPSEETDPNLFFGSPKAGDYVRSGQWITTDSDFVVLEL